MSDQTARGQLLHLVLGGELTDLGTVEFRDLSKLDIVGGSPRVQDELRTALAPELGRSLLRIDAAEIGRRVAELPDIVGVSYDRRFPHTLHLRIDAERPVLLLRRGKNDTWLVSARARVMRGTCGRPLASAT